MINPNTYYTVQGWMREALGLKDKELTVYAIIYGFSQDGNSEYSGSARYLAEWIGCSRSTIMVVLKSLVEKGLLRKRDVYQNGVGFCTYTAVTTLPEIGQGVRNSDRGVSENQTGGVRNSDRGCPEIGHNNTRDIYINNNRNIDIGGEKNSPPPPPAEKEEKKPVKHKHGEYKNVLLTDDELAALKTKFPDDWAERIERLSEYIAYKGTKYKSHYATICAWAKRDAKAAQPATRGGRPATVTPNGRTIDPTKTDLDAYF